MSSSHSAHSTGVLPGFDGSEPPDIVERYLEEVRRLSPAERFRHSTALSGEVLRLSFHGFRNANDDLSADQVVVEFARLTWGDEVARLYAAALTR